MTPLGRVLLVEDSEPHRYVVSSWLQRAGYSVEEAATGAEGLDRATSDIDVAVLDVHLPDMSGFDLCSRIKTAPATSTVPVLHVSATAIDVHSRAEGLNRGADAYLIEPLERDEFLAVVRALARSHETRRKTVLLAERLARLAAVSLPVNAADSLLRLLEATASGAADILGQPALAAAESDTGQLRALCVSPGAAPRTEVVSEPLDLTWIRELTPGEAAAPPPAWSAMLARNHVADRRWCAVAVRDDGSGRACIAVAVPPGETRVREDDGALVRQLADAMGVALLNLRAYVQEHSIALTLQQALLPERLPEPPGLSLAARYIASSDQASVGGDFYDAFELPDGRLAVVVGDVQGHSLRAATVMAELRFSLRAYLNEMHDPTTALRLLNDLLQHSHPEETATVVLLLFDPACRYVDVASAGHLPALLVTPTDAELLDVAGVLLGVPAPRTDPVRVQLSGPCSLVLITDGLIETRDAGLGEVLQTFRDVVLDLGTLDPERICDALVHRFVSPETDDDVAVLAVSVAAPPRPA